MAILQKKTKNIKKQRDRFLAFSFASADLFLEVTPKGKITFTIGAAVSLTGVQDSSLVGRKWLELFDENEHARLLKMQEDAIPGLRCGPLLIAMNKNMSERKGIVTALKMPNNENLFVTLGLSNVLMDTLATLMEEHEDGPLVTGFKAEDENTPEPLTTGYKAEDLKEEEPVTTDFKAELEKQEALTTDIKAEDIAPEQPLETGFKADDLEPEEGLTTGFDAGDEGIDDSLYNKSEFIEEAESAFEFAKNKKIDAAVTIFDFERTSTIPEENWAEIIGKVSALLKKHSLDGKIAAEIGNDQYSVLHGGDEDIQKLEAAIQSIAQNHDPEGNGITISTHTIQADLDSLTGQEASRALFYTLNEEKNDEDGVSIVSLGDNYKKKVKDNKSKLEEFKDIVERVDFDIHFQPIVDLKTEETTHFEVLSRFRNGDTLDWIMFAEDMELCADFDVAVVERAMNYIHYKAGTTRTKFSVNISNKSIENPEFLEKLKEQLAKRDLKHRIMVEITQTSAIKNHKRVYAFVKVLQNDGYEVALDDVTANKSAIDMLQQIPVDYIKIHDKNIRRLLTSDEDHENIQNLIKECKNMGINVVAKAIETQEQADILKKMGAKYAQGYLFGKAANAPSFKPPKK